MGRLGVEIITMRKVYLCMTQTEPTVCLWCVDKSTEFVVSKCREQFLNQSYYYTKFVGILQHCLKMWAMTFKESCSHEGHSLGQRTNMPGRKAPSLVLPSAALEWDVQESRGRLSSIYLLKRQEKWKKKKPMTFLYDHENISCKLLSESLSAFHV